MFLSMSLGGTVARASTVNFGTLTPFTGGDAGEGLDLSGNIVYAFNLGGLGGTQTVQGVDFLDASVFAPPVGITTPVETLEFDYVAANPDGANGADYGATANDDAMDTIVNSVWYNTNFTIDLAVTPGTQYQLQLILQESFWNNQGTPNRDFDVSVETASPDTLSLAVEDLVLGMETDGAAPAQPGADFGQVYQYTFTATDSSFRVALDDNPAGVDVNAVLAAVTLEQLGADTTSPGIATLDPANEASAVPVFSDLEVTFDEIVAFGSGNITIKESVGGAVVESFDVATSPNLLLDGPSITINPSDDLAGMTGYFVEIDPGAIDDLAGNSFAGIPDADTWSFTTAATDVTAPTVATIDDPANEATDVPLDTSLALTFDEEVQKATGNIVIRRIDDNSVVATIDVSTGNVTAGVQVVIVPNVILPSMTGLYVEIDAGAFQDLAGNPFVGISGLATWGFTTVEVVPTPVTAFTGGDLGEGLDLSGTIVYAFNLGPGLTQTVQGVEFVAASVLAPPAGITTPVEILEFDYATANPGGANYGATADDDALESIVNSVWYNMNWAFDLEVVPGTEYQLQLIFQESFFPSQGTPARNFDVSMGAAADPLNLVLDDFAQGLETNGANQPEADFGVVFTHTFTASDSSFRVALDDNPDVIEDPNAVLAAVVLQEFSGIGFAITEISYDADADTVTLTWSKTSAASYIAKVSPDMTDWDADLDDGITAMSDENPDDADRITVTFPLTGIADERLFFRIEAG